MGDWSFCLNNIKNKLKKGFFSSRRPILGTIDYYEIKNYKGEKLVGILFFLGYVFHEAD